MHVTLDVLLEKKTKGKIINEFIRSFISIFHDDSADHEEDRFNRRSMVRLGVRVIHKITAETKVPPIIQPSPHKLSKSLRLRLSPKALKLPNKFSTSVDETQHRKLHDCNNAGGGSMSRIDMANHSTTITTENHIRQSKVCNSFSTHTFPPLLWASSFTRR